MSILTSAEQLTHVIRSPLAITNGNKQFYISLTGYALLGIIIFGWFGHTLIQNQEALKQLVMHYLLPSSWHWLSEKLFNFFFESQTKIVLVSMIVSGSMVIASVLLFPLKEYCSALFERRIDPTATKADEFPLILQALEESKLLFLYVTAQSVIFAIGYYPYQWSSWTSNTLSVLFLCFSFGLDFIAPTLQRHRIKYNTIVKFLLQKSIVTLLFGALFTLPTLHFGQWLVSQKEIELVTVSAILFAINLLMLTLAIPAGTYIAVHLRQSVTDTESFTGKQKRSLYGILAAALLVSGCFHFLVARSMHHKSQILKCQYNIEWSSFDLAMPNFREFIAGQKAAELDFNLEIYNPTTFNLEIEDSEIIFSHLGQKVSSTKLAAFKVASGETAIQKMQLLTDLNVNTLMHLSELKKDWNITLEFTLLPGIPFVIELYKTPKM